MIRTAHSLSLAVVVLAAVSSAGCSKDPPPAQNPQPYAGGYQQPGQPQPGAYPQPGQAQPGGYQPQPGGYQPQPGQPMPQPGQTQPVPGQTQPLPGIPGLGQPAPAGAGGGTAQALDPNLAALATGPLGMYASTEAPGMTKDGAIIAGNFQTGQTLEGTFTFQPGKCYTLVASGVGVSGVTLEMQYVTPIPGLAPSIQKNDKSGAQASIGGKANCLRPLSPFPAQAKYIVTARAGAGIIAAQLFSK